ncbi:MAG: hypothetical protein Q9183_007271, partial [Haloplaca sp. 2 TL-2023]
MPRPTSIIASLSVSIRRPLQASRPQRRWLSRDSLISQGTKTPSPPAVSGQKPKSPYYFDTGYALYAKRPSRPFPPPFLSIPSRSFSDPLSTHNKSRDRRPYVNGEIIRGITNGDDAVLVSENFIGANDGVGAWAQKPRGHAALWSRLILHFWALEAERDGKVTSTAASSSQPDPIAYLQTAYERTVEATSAPSEWKGTTTACGAQLHHISGESTTEPMLFVTNLGDSQVMVVRPQSQEILYKTTEQWHWFDCPRQLGTNSPDTPKANAVMDKVSIREGDVVLAMSDGVVDNLWEHEVSQSVHDSMHDSGSGSVDMLHVAGELVRAARRIAEDPYAESPFMERAIEEGLAMEG